MDNFFISYIDYTLSISLLNSSSGDTTIKFGISKKREEFTVHTSYFYSIAWSQDGKYLVVATINNQSVESLKRKAYSVDLLQ